MRSLRHCRCLTEEWGRTAVGTCRGASLPTRVAEGHSDGLGPLATLRACSLSRSLGQATQEQQEKGEEEREAAHLASQELAEVRGELQRAQEGHDLAEQVAISSDLPRASPRTRC